MDKFPAVSLMRTYGFTKIQYPHFAKNEDGKRWAASTKIEGSDRSDFQELYVIVRKYCENLELAASLATIDKMLDVLKNPQSSYADFFGFGAEFSSRLADELKNRDVLALTTKESAIFNHPLRGWEKIAEALPETIDDIVESQKCYALNRYAAAVFHSLQVVEFGLIAFGKHLGVDDPLSGWTAVSRKLKAIIDTRYQNRTPFEQKHSGFLEQVSGTVESLKNAWRNKVSHAHGKLTLMTSDFSPEIAEEILFATRAFMRRLVTDGPLSGK